MIQKGYSYGDYNEMPSFNTNMGNNYSLTEQPLKMKSYGKTTETSDVMQEAALAGASVAAHNQTLTADNAYVVSYLAVNASKNDYFEIYIQSTADTSYSVIGNTTSTWFEIYKI